jgi:hypothetical protein
MLRNNGSYCVASLIFDKPVASFRNRSRSSFICLDVSRDKRQYFLLYCYARDFHKD